MSREELIERTAKLSRLNRETLLRYSKKNNRIELIILVLTSITAGALWALIAASFETFAAWAGAALTTLAAGLTLYQKLAQSPKSLLDEALALQKEIDEEIVNLKHTSEHTEEAHDRSYKGIASKAIFLKYQGRDLSTLTPQERMEYEQNFEQ